MLKPAITFKQLYLLRHALDGFTAPALTSLGKMDPIQLAKSEKKELLQSRLIAQPQLLANRRLAPPHAPFVFFHRRDVFPAKSSVERVCACAQAQVRLQLPVFPVMDRLAAGNREV